MRNSKLILIFFFLLQILFVKVYGQMSKSDSIEMANDQYEINKMWDSICISQTKLAKEEISKGKLTYVIPKGMVEMFDSDAELDFLLSKYKIRTVSQGIFCTAPSDKQFCYGDLMNKEIERLYGINFIEKKRDEAEKIFITKNINKIFFTGDCDRDHSIYPLAKTVDEYIDRYDRDYFKDFVYPKDYKHRKENDLYSYTSVEFILTKEGKIKNLKVHSSLQDSYNKKFTKEFEDKAKKFVENIAWIPNKKRGISVNSKESVTFLYDKNDR